MTSGVCIWQFSQTAQPQALPVPSVDPAVSKLWLVLEFCVCLAIETLHWRLDQWLILSFSVRSPLMLQNIQLRSSKNWKYTRDSKFWRLFSVLLRIPKGDIFLPPILNLEFIVCPTSSLPCYFSTSRWKKFGNQDTGPGQHWGHGCF